MRGKLQAPAAAVGKSEAAIAWLKDAFGGLARVWPSRTVQLTLRVSSLYRAFGKLRTCLECEPLPLSNAVWHLPQQGPVQRAHGSKHSALDPLMSRHVGRRDGREKRW
jgi:hypothetical protein